MSVLKGVIRGGKQYTVENAYPGNEKVSRYTDGELEFYELCPIGKLTDIVLH